MVIKPNYILQYYFEKIYACATVVRHLLSTHALPPALFIAHRICASRLVASLRRPRPQCPTSESRMKLATGELNYTLRAIRLPPGTNFMTGRGEAVEMGLAVRVRRIFSPV